MGMGAVINRALKSKALGFTRDMALASGNQAITGVGLKPKTISFLTVQNLVVGRMSIGNADNSGGGVSISDYQNIGAGEWVKDTVGIVIYIYQSATEEYRGIVASLDDDGYTLTWTKVGTITGIITIGSNCLA